MLAQINKELCNGDLNKALEFANIVAIDALQFIEPSDIHYKQAVSGLERSLKLAKKMAAFKKEHEKAFSDIITKLKKGNLAKEEKINPLIPMALNEELRKYWEQDLEVWNDGWSPDHIAFRYFNIRQEYLQKNDVRTF